MAKEVKKERNNAVSHGLGFYNQAKKFTLQERLGKELAMKQVFCLLVLLVILALVITCPSFGQLTSYIPSGTPNFRVSLWAKTVNLSHRPVWDIQNYAGMDTAANNNRGFDAWLDNVEPPIAPEGVSLYYQNDSLRIGPFDKFQTDIRDADLYDLSSTYEIWDLYIVNQGFVAIDTLLMNIEESVNLPANYSVVLSNGSTFLDLRREKFYQMVGTEPVRLWLYVGTGVPWGRQHFKPVE
jgi:hypothetical protein